MKSLLLSGIYLSTFAALVACSGADSETGSLRQALEAQRCGGNIANAPTCPTGFECVPDPNSSLPFGDVGGICQAQHCGGNIANAPTCPDGFECVPDPDSSLPFGDVGGICQAASDQPQHCGGNIANPPTCPDGFECVPDPNSSLPFGDVGGICQAASDDGGAPDHGHHHRRQHRHGRH